MKTLAIALLAGLVALSIGSARAWDPYVTIEYANTDLVQQVRTVCDRRGNCYQSRSEVVVQDTFNYVQRDRYNPPRHRNRRWDDGPPAGVGIRAPGPSVGGGSDRW